MSSNPASEQLTSPLSIGNVVSTSLRLYRSHLKQYLGIALIASFWIALPFIILLLFIALAAVLFSNQTEGAGIFLLLIPVWFVFLLYCYAKSLLNSALISLLAFKELLNQPETVKAARRQLRSRTWLFLLTQFLMGLIFFVINVCLFLIQLLLFNLPAGIIGNVLADDQSIISLLLIVVGNLFYYAASLWFTARFFIPEVPLAVETNTSSLEAIDRSWKLTKGFVLRIIVVGMIAFLLTIPLYGIAIIPLIITLVAAVPFTPDTLPDEVAIALFVALVVGGILLMLASILAIPLWQAVKGVIYYDLRSRREEIEIETHD